MRASESRAAPLSGWPRTLARAAALSVPACLISLETALAAGEAPSLDARTLLTLGINLGIIAFAVGTAIACLRATERARKAEAGSGRAGLGDVDRRTHAITFVVEQGRRTYNLTSAQHAKAPRRRWTTHRRTAACG